MLRSHKLSEVDKKLIGKKVELCGWIDSVRGHGKLIFIDLRDRYGKVQCVIKKDNKNFETAKSLTSETSIKITGEVKARLKGTENKDLSSGEVEIVISDFEIFNLCPVLPFEVNREDVNEDVRMNHRFLDLRSERMQKNMILRSKVFLSVLEFFEKEDFVHLETPILGKSTPEGSRDFLVPSRKEKGSFYALPQSPQLFKQLSQIAGFDKYIQIPRCFRDEDTRKDRQPEFTQIDVEMSFVEEKDIIDLVERMLKYIFKKVLNKDIKTPFKRISYDESMKKYGRDNPDLRKDPTNKGEFAFCWVVDFPTFEYSKEEKRYKATHHPFTSPIAGKKGKLDFNEKSKSRAYDVVLNGSEIGGGSIRIHDSEVQSKVFDILKISKSEAQNKFGFLLDALKFGAPPHGGIAFGLDRLVQLMVGEENIREVIAFPKNKEARDMMLNAPSNVDNEQLDEIGLSLKKIKKNNSK